MGAKVPSLRARIVVVAALLMSLLGLTACTVDAASTAGNAAPDAATTATAGHPTAEAATGQSSTARTTPTQRMTRPPRTTPASHSAGQTPAARKAGTRQSTRTPAAAGTALSMLESLPVKGRAPKTGYEREKFGYAWKDVDHNGCDTRNDILGRDLSAITYRNSVPCKVATGTLVDPYSAGTIHFVQGPSTSSAVQIDHLVALSNAWQTGAQQLSTAQREALANDPLNLLASDGPLNMQKGDGDAATWLPPNKSFRCTYVARQVSVKHKYRLWVTAPEHAAIVRVLGTCPGKKAAMTGGLVAVVPAVPAPAAPAPAAPAPAAPAAPAPAAPANVHYQNCSAVRAAGADPIHVGDPGYSSKLDRDGDGVGCE